MSERVPTSGQFTYMDGCMDDYCTNRGAGDLFHVLFAAQSARCIGAWVLWIYTPRTPTPRTTTVQNSYCSCTIFLGIYNKNMSCNNKNYSVGDQVLGHETGAITAWLVTDK